MKKYPIKAVLFTKNGSLEDYYKKCKYSKSDSPSAAKEIQLYLTVAYGDDNKKYCKINCPVNPLPIIGWWQVPDCRSVIQLLKNLGWAYQHETPLYKIARNFEN